MPTDLDGDDVLARILLLPSDFQQTLTLYALLADADREALERLLEEADRLQPRREGHAAKSIIYSRYAELAPEAAIERILADDSGLLQRVIRAWAKYDHAAALQRAETLPATYRRRAGATILSVSEDLLPAQRDEIAATFGLREQLEEMRIVEAINADPADAWRRALAVPASSQRKSTLYRVAQRWVERDPERALLAVGELPRTSARRRLQKELMAHWAMADSEAAHAWLQAQRSSGLPAATTVGFAIGLAQSAPRQALDFSLGLAEPPTRGRGQRGTRRVGTTEPQSGGRGAGRVGRHRHRQGCEQGRNACLVDDRCACRSRLATDA